MSRMWACAAYLISPIGLISSMVTQVSYFILNRQPHDVGASPASQESIIDHHVRHVNRTGRHNRASVETELLFRVSQGAGAKGKRFTIPSCTGMPCSASWNRPGAKAAPLRRTLYF
jgi:hypothetical protein